MWEATREMSLETASTEMRSMVLPKTVGAIVQQQTEHLAFLPRETLGDTVGSARDRSPLEIELSLWLLLVLLRVIRPI